MPSPRLLKGIGYWQSDEASILPHPEYLVDDGWLAEERERIIAYLQAGRQYLSYGRFSFCRFKCGADPSDMGHCDLTDGEWVWPEGLAHYVEHHHVILPMEFVQSMRRNDWEVPPDVIVPEVQEGYHIMDMKFWIQWASTGVESKR
jgi:hypothetical protein